MNVTQCNKVMYSGECSLGFKEKMRFGNRTNTLNYSALLYTDSRQVQGFPLTAATYSSTVLWWPMSFDCARHFARSSRFVTVAPKRMRWSVL